MFRHTKQHNSSNNVFPEQQKTSKSYRRRRTSQQQNRNISNTVFHNKIPTRTSTIPIITFLLLLSTTPMVHSNIGDNIRSNESSISFFQSVDKDGDGILRAAEVANFLEHEIGDTSSFVTSYEISSEANRVIRALDQNEDETVEQRDIMEYWDHMDNLLTAEEVEEWVVNAVQLPEYVGRIFKENAVTGYDFAELVENNGEILKTELGITKLSFVKKIVNLMHARMLGIGNVPEAPKNFKYKVEENCHSVTFNWDKSYAAGFPVHSYSVQKRAISMTTSIPSSSQQQSNINTSKSYLDNICNKYPDGKFVTPLKYYDDDICREEASFNHKQQSHYLNWVTIYQGADTEFFDHSLEPGYSFKYRIQAWNSVGRSLWETADISDQLKKLKCLKTPSNSAVARITRSLILSNNFDDSFSSSQSFKKLYFFSGLLITIARGVVAVAAFIAALMKWKRASCDSTMLVATMFTPFLKLFQYINTMSKNMIGIEIIPSYILGASDDNDVVAHDVYVNAVGLNGFKKGGVTFTENETPFDRRWKLSRSESQRNNSCRSLLSSSDDSHSPILSVGINEASDSNNNNNIREIKLKEKSSSKFNNIKLIDRKKSQCGGCDPSSPIIAKIDDHPQNSNRSCITTSRTNCSSIVEEYDDYTICNTCRKKYKLGRRYRHHCARCLSTFCHKHGRTTHSNFTSCKIPGSCVCNKCLEIDKNNIIEG